MNGPFCPECGYDYRWGVDVFSYCEAKQTYIPGTDTYDDCEFLDIGHTLVVQCPQCSTELPITSEHELDAFAEETSCATP